MTKDDNEPDESKGSGAIRTILTDLFESIAEMDERNQRRRSGTGTARSGNKRFDYGFNVGIGPQSPEPERKEAKTPPASADADHATTVHETDEGVVVTLDFSGVDPRSLSAGVDSSDRTFVVALDGEVETRVPLPHGDLEVADASFNNGVLDVRLRPTGGDE